MLKPLAAILGLFTAIATAQNGGLDHDSLDSVSQPPATSQYTDDLAEAEQLYRSGSVLVTAGHVLATGGVVLNLIGTVGGNPDMTLLGSLGFNIGLPLLGAGAGTVNKAASKINPDYRPNYRGWGWYGTGFVLGITGSALFNRALKQANRAESQGAQDEALDNTVFPLLMILGSGVCGIVTWVKFSAFASEAGRPAAYQRSLRVDPKVSLNRAGEVEPGMTITYRF